MTGTLPSRRPRILRRLLPLVLAGLPLLPADARGDDLGQILARPVSPGTLALLIPHVPDARVPTRWREALTHDDPRVRGTAARLLLIGNVTAAAPVLEAALTREADREAAVEEARALLSLAGPGADEAVFAAARAFRRMPSRWRLPRSGARPPLSCSTNSAP